MCPVSRRKVTGLQGSQVLARLSEGLGGHERREGVGLRKVGRPQAPREPFEKAPCGPGQQVARLSPRTRATRHAPWCLSLCGSRVSCRLCFCLSCGRGAPCTSWGRRDMLSVRTLVSSRPFLPPAAYRAAVTSRSEALGSEARTASSAPRVGSRTAGDQALGPMRRVRRAEPCPACRQPPRGQVQGEAPTSRGAAPATWASAGKPVGAGRARTCGEKSPRSDSGPGQPPRVKRCESGARLARPHRGRPVSAEVGRGHAAPWPSVSERRKCWRGVCAPPTRRGTGLADPARRLRSRPWLPFNGSPLKPYGRRD